jgi:hypothetical protein
MPTFIDVKYDEILNHEFAVAAFDLLPGTIISRSEPNYLDHPTIHTICIDFKTHASLDNNGRFLSHACDSAINCRVVFDQNAKTFAVEVIRKVAKGETLAFNYNCTEWEMQCPFDCACITCANGKKSNHIRGFKYLSTDEQAVLLEFSSPYVQSMAVGMVFSNLSRCKL